MNDRIYIKLTDDGSYEYGSYEMSPKKVGAVIDAKMGNAADYAEAVNALRAAGYTVREPRRPVPPVRIAA